MTLVINSQGEFMDLSPTLVLLTFFSLMIVNIDSQNFAGSLFSQLMIVKIDYKNFAWHKSGIMNVFY